MYLKDKVVLITGSSIGIGAAIAEEFAKEKTKVVITYNKNKAAAEKVEAICKNAGADDTLVLHLDVTGDKSIEATVKKVVGRYGQIDVLVNNAGVYADGSVESTSMEEIQNQIRVNVEGLIKMTHVALPHLKGPIVNISSRAGLVASPGNTTYAASKWAVRGFSKSLASEIDLPVYCVNPKGTATQMNDFTGDSPFKVARIVVDVVSGKMKIESGADVNVWEY